MVMQCYDSSAFCDVLGPRFITRVCIYLFNIFSGTRNTGACLFHQKPVEIPYCSEILLPFQYVSHPSISSAFHLCFMLRCHFHQPFP
jgi:hypothetical protein